AFADFRTNVLDLTPGSTALAAIQTAQSNGVTILYLPQTAPPRIHLAASWVIAANASSGLPFTASDEVTPASQLAFNVASSNGQLFPSANLSVSATNFGERLNVTPAAGQTGSASLTVRVSNNAGLSSVATVEVNVLNPQL